MSFTIVNAITTPHLFNLLPVHFARIAKVFRPVGLKGRGGHLEGAGHCAPLTQALLKLNCS